MNNLSRIFKNRFGHFRAGWRIILYSAVIITFFELSDLLENSILLIQGENLTDYTLLGNRFINKTLKFLSVFAASMILLKWFDKRPVSLFGLGVYKGFLKEFFLGMMLGVILGTTSIFILWITGVATFSFNGFSTDMLFYVLFCLVILMFSAAHEEIVFRGYVFQALIEGSSFWISVGLFSLLFGLFHIDHGIGRVLFALSAGLFLGVLYFKTRALWLCIGMHFMWNWIMAPLFGIGVQGSKFLRRSIFYYQPTDSDLFGGSDAMSVIIQGLFMIILAIIAWKSNWLKPAEYNSRLWRKYPPQYGADPVSKK